MSGRSEDLATWDDLLRSAMEAQVDAGPVIAKAPDDPNIWAQQFDSGFGGSRGAHVLAWTGKRVYFPVVYDGVEVDGVGPSGSTGRRAMSRRWRMKLMPR